MSDIVEKEAADEIELLQAEIAALKMEIEMYEKQFANNHAEIERLRADLESGMEWFYSQGVELDNAKAEIERLQGLQRIVREQAEENERMWGEKAKDKAEIERLRKDIEVGRLARKQVAKISAVEIDRLHAEIERLRKELTAAITAKGSAELEIERLQGLVDNMVELLRFKDARLDAGDETSAETYNRLVKSGWAPPAQVADFRAESERLNAAILGLVTQLEQKVAEIKRLQAIVIAQDNEIEQGMAEIKKLRQKLDKAAEALAQVLALPYPPQKGS